MNDVVTVRIAADHPALAGHFPGDPIVPAVVILDEVIAAWEGRSQRPRVHGIAQAKFMARVNPGSDMRVEFSATAVQRVQFTCTVHGQLVARGQLLVSPAHE